MAVFNKLNGFVEHLAEGVHDLGSNQLVLALSNVAPSAESYGSDFLDERCVLGNVTQISYSNLSSRQVTTSSGYAELRHLSTDARRSDPQRDWNSRTVPIHLPVQRYADQSS